MMEENDMGLAALRFAARGSRPQDRRTRLPSDHGVTPGADAALERSPPDRFATASLLATGLAHEIANPLACLMAALDWTKEPRRADARAGSADAAQIDSKLVPDVELALVSAQTITSLIRDFQLFLRPDEITPMSAPPRSSRPIERAVRMARPRLGP